MCIRDSALYEVIFVLLETLKEEQAFHQQVLDKSEKESVLASLKSQDKHRDEARHDADARARQHQELFFSPSSYFIKNKTGEILLFKAGREPAFTEMQPNETLPLVFQKEQASDVGPVSKLLSGSEDNLDTFGGSKGGFTGPPSSDVVPSERSGEQTTSEEESDPEEGADTDFALTFGMRQGMALHKARSIFRRGRFRFKKSEPSRVQLQVLIQHGKQLEKTPSFEVNFDNLMCQRVYLDE